MSGKYSEADRESVVLADDGVIIEPPLLTRVDVIAVARSMLEKRRPAYESAWRLYRRWSAPIPIAARRGALAGWEKPHEAMPTMREIELESGRTIRPDDLSLGAPHDGVSILFGAVGGGKSSIAARWVMRGHAMLARWEDARDFDFRANDTVRALCEWCVAAEGPLVIDDLGKCSPDEATAITGVCLQRADRMRGTLITTNLDRETLHRTLGSRLCDRVARWVEVNGQSKRSGKASDSYAAQMDRVQDLCARWATPYASAYRMVRQLVDDEAVTLRHLYTLASIAPPKGNSDEAWLDDTIAAMIAEKGTT
jgi:hypothetical protein